MNCLYVKRLFLTKLLFVCLCAAFVMSCSSSKRPASNDGYVVDSDVSANDGDTNSDESTDRGDNLSDVINDIRKHLPLMVEKNWLQLKKIELDESEEVLTLFITNNENIRGDWWGDKDEKYWGKFIVAQLVGLPEELEKLSHLDSEELEELKEDKDFLKAMDNMPNYKKTKNLLKKVSDMGYGIRLKLHSKDNYTATVVLQHEDARDAIVFYQEILEKVEKDNTIVDAF